MVLQWNEEWTIGAQSHPQSVIVWSFTLLVMLMAAALASDRITTPNRHLYAVPIATFRSAAPFDHSLALVYTNCVFTIVGTLD